MHLGATGEIPHKLAENLQHLGIRPGEFATSRNQARYVYPNADGSPLKHLQYSQIRTWRPRGLTETLSTLKLTTQYGISATEFTRLAMRILASRSRTSKTQFKAVNRKIIIIAPQM
ncbi:hypothetical protein QE152_g152 [Popillia japonica]|uniref:Uncharacterized protein n=1 Tax=Popillia japonica TaxID=7064 RepID=A0AAW1NKB2_POPJA